MKFDRSLVLDGSLEDLIAGFAALAAATLFFLLTRARADRPGTELHEPMLAWLRGGIFFSLAIVAAWANGALSAVIRAPMGLLGGPDDTGWVVLTALAIVIEFLGYWVIWPRGTFVLDRVRHLPSQIGFGIAWGISEALVFLTILAVLGEMGLSRGLTALVAYPVIAAWQFGWHFAYWDIHVAPAHNIPEWNGLKVIFAHTPNVVITLVHFALFANPGLILVFQTVSIVGSTIAMRFPPWFAPSSPRADKFDTAGAY